MKRSWRRRAMLSCLLIVLVWFFWFQNDTIVSGEISIAIDGLPEAFEGFRIVLLADLQGKSFGRENSRLIEAARAAEPDLIAVCGDLIDREEELAIIPGLAQALTAIAPTYYVTGNHEWASGAVYELMQLLSDAGVTVLANDYVPLERDGASIALAGVHDPNGPYDMMQPDELLAQLRGKEGQLPVLMLAHRNDSLEMWSELDVDLVLCGHGHGGVIRLPFVGGLLGTDRTLFPDYTAGLYRQDATQMVVSRGLGNSGVPFRLFNRPDLPVVILTAQEAS